MSVVAIIPARYGSTRFPGKPLALLRSKPMILHVYERTRLVSGLDRILVATDDERIARVVENFGGEAVMTGPDHPTGTDRLAEAARPLPAEIVVNVQGDLPFFPPRMVGDAVERLQQTPQAAMATVQTPIYDPDEWHNPNVVKVVTDQRGFALYFSRSPIPWRPQRKKTAGLPATAKRSADRSESPPGVLGQRHIGLYVYRKDFLLKFAELPPTPLEKTEKLEQLRALECGHKICVTDTRRPTIEVDTPEDLRRAEETLLATEAGRGTSAVGNEHE